MIRPPRATDAQRTRAVVFCAALLSFGSPARAQTAAPSIAEQLFVEGRALMQEQKYEAACDKFRAAYELDTSATGTLLNLALCNEAVGKHATAWAQFRKVAAQSAGRREDRVALAREHEQRLAPMLSRIGIVVPPDARAGGLRIVLDGVEPIVEAAWGSEFPVDPGKHVLAISAPGRVSAEQTFEVGASGDRQQVVIRPLAAAEGTPPPVPTPPPEPPPQSTPNASGNGQRTAGYVVGAAGIASIGVGLAFGLIASNRNSDAKDLCPNDRCPSDAIKTQASSELASANTAANVANVAAGVGAAAVIVAGVLVFTAPSPGKSKSGARGLRFGAAPTGAGGWLTVGGSY